MFQGGKSGGLATQLPARPSLFAERRCLRISVLMAKKKNVPILSLGNPVGNPPLFPPPHFRELCFSIEGNARAVTGDRGSFRQL